MNKSQLDYSYPEHLVATERASQSRVMLVEGGRPREISFSHLLTEMSPDDLLVLNETQVIPARVFSEEGLELLFIKPLGDNSWQVLTPARRWPKIKKVRLPEGVEAELVEGGLPQKVQLNQDIGTAYFERNGEVPLPPYIHQARGEERARPSDSELYQTAWAQTPGSLAAPTASLHFSRQDLERLKDRGAQVAKLCLHVGLGTFLPIHVEDLNEHKMHQEWVQIPHSTWQAVRECRERGGRVWSLGTTVTRALESAALGYFAEQPEGLVGETDLFIKPGFEYQVTDVLLTNFHQPQSTLLALVMAFAGEQTVRDCYTWAIEHQFRLFSYGDLSVWKRK